MINTLLLVLIALHASLWSHISNFWYMTKIDQSSKILYRGKMDDAKFKKTVKRDRFNFLSGVFFPILLVVLILANMHELRQLIIWDVALILSVVNLILAIYCYMSLLFLSMDYHKAAKSRIKDIGKETRTLKLGYSKVVEFMKVTVGLSIFVLLMNLIVNMWLGR